MSLTKCVVAAVVSLVVFGAPSAAWADESFRAVYEGTFTISGNGLLEFHGSGSARRLGPSTVDRTTQLVPIPGTTCFHVLPVLDSVTLTGRRGDTLALRNQGTDCFDTGNNAIVGSGTFLITGGTGRLAGASGGGTYEVTATATGPVSGNFRLVWRGSLDQDERD